MVFGSGGFSEGASVSTRRRIVGGTTRPVGNTDLPTFGNDASGSRAGLFNGLAVFSVAGSVWGSVTKTGASGSAGVSGSGDGFAAVSGAASTAGSVSIAVSASTEGVAGTTVASASAEISSSVFGGATLGDLTSRGGPSLGRIAGSRRGELFALFRLVLEEAGFCENSGPVGRLTSRSRATRSANCLATISSIVLEALFTSMPCSRLSRSMTSWLGIPSRSATLYIRIVANVCPLPSRYAPVVDTVVEVNDRVPAASLLTVRFGSFAGVR